MRGRIRSPRTRSPIATAGQTDPRQATRALPIAAAPFRKETPADEQPERSNRLGADERRASPQPALHQRRWLIIAAVGRDCPPAEPSTSPNVRSAQTPCPHLG